MSRHRARLDALERRASLDPDEVARECAAQVDDLLTLPVLEYFAMSDVERRRAVDEMADTILTPDDTPEDRDELCTALHQVYASYAPPVVVAAPSPVPPLTPTRTPMPNATNAAPGPALREILRDTSTGRLFPSSPVNTREALALGAAERLEDSETVSLLLTNGADGATTPTTMPVRDAERTLHSLPNGFAIIVQPAA